MGEPQNLDLSNLDAFGLSPRARDIAQLVLHLFGTRTNIAAELSVDTEDTVAEVIRVIPTKPDASAIGIWIYRQPVDDDQLIGISAGGGLYLNIPESAAHISTNTMDIILLIVGAIKAGRLVETVYTKRGIAYRWDAMLLTDRGEIKLNRTNLPRYFKGLFGKRVMKTTHYAPY